jgi:asparagine synthase (glutamine-hydrolysing)
MCGILGLFGNNESCTFQNKRTHFLEMSKRIRHRGPDWNGIYYNLEKKVLIGHERLSIVAPETGSQPIISEDKSIILSVNGEIYNYKELYKYVLHDKYKPTTKSDCEVILDLYREYGANMIKMLDGIFSFILYDSNKDILLMARDPIGIIPLYYGITDNCEIMIASECKCLTEECKYINVFPPGHYMEITNLSSTSGLDNTSPIRYYEPLYALHESVPFIEYNSPEEAALKSDIRELLINAVDKRLMADVPFGVLLSGGLDSSLIAAITSRIMKSRSTNEWGNTLHTFSIGLENAPDLIAARKVADFLGTRHHEFIFTVQDGIDAIRDLIWHLETYDVTTIRASTPMYLMSRKIKSLGIKMVLSGEGADEVFGGYLYFHNAPNNKEFHKECVKRVSELHHFDCLRANKSTMAWGIEARVPFLDQALLETCIPIHSDNKLKGIEKYILRSAFDTREDPYLPDNVLWRQKEQFSDGVGYSWIDSLKEFVENAITDEEFAVSQLKSKEEFYYKKIFEELFPKTIPVIRWIPRTEWEGVGYDPSGRAQIVHDAATDNN